MNRQKIDVIATSISGSIKDWRKVKYIVPLFKKNGFDNVSLFTVDSHEEARKKARQCIKNGGRIIISAGGSGTFNSVLEGCCDSEEKLENITLGFLRKGSADLLGKTLGMPDDIENAIKVFVDSIISDKTIKCDVILVESEKGNTPARHFVGYAGAEIFGKIPYYTENRFTKYYKGVLGQLLGDSGPFFVGASLASAERIITQIYKRKRKWSIYVDDLKVPKNAYHAFIIVNGDLGKDLPLARAVPLGSGDFYLFSLKDIGILRLIGQFKHTWNASILDEPDIWGFQSYRAKESLTLQPEDEIPFDVNVDGATMVCAKSVKFTICDQITLISK